MHIVFHRHKKSFLIIEIKLRHCITLKKKHLRKTILLLGILNLFYPWPTFNTDFFVAHEITLIKIIYVYL